MFSATLHSNEIIQASELFCQNPMWVDLKGKDYIPDRVQQSVFYVDVTDKNQHFLYDVTLCGKYTDRVHLGSELHLPLVSKEDISEVLNYSFSYSKATKRVKLQIVKRLIDKYKMNRVMVLIY